MCLTSWTGTDLQLDSLLFHAESICLRLADTLLHLRKCGRFFFYYKPKAFVLTTCDCEGKSFAKLHLLESLPLRGHVHLQVVIRGGHLTHGQFDRLLLEHYAVTIGLLEARRLVILRGDCRAQDRDNTHSEQFIQSQQKDSLMAVCVRLNGQKALIH